MVGILSFFTSYRRLSNGKLFHRSESPLLIPRSSLWDNCLSVLSRSGSIILSPLSWRRPFPCFYRGRPVSKEYLRKTSPSPTLHRKAPKNTGRNLSVAPPH